MNIVNTEYFKCGIFKRNIQKERIYSCSVKIWDFNGINQQQKHLRHMTKIMDSLINAAGEALDTNRDSSDRSDTERDLMKK